MEAEKVAGTTVWRDSSCKHFKLTCRSWQW